jgi:transposase-like protein
MDPQTVFCPNSDCPARGQLGKGNIGIFHKKERRYICHQCHHTFAETKGTVFYRRRMAPDLITLVVTLLAHGCPVQAIVAAFALDARTVQDWQTRAGAHCQQVHEHLVQQPRDLGQVQADEIRVKLQGQIVWLAMAMQVATRLWLGAVVSAQRDETLLTTLMQRVRACAKCRPLLFCVDGYRAYLPAIRNVFREHLDRRGQPGRALLRPWDGLVIGQMVKQTVQGHVVGVVRNLVQGSEEEVRRLLQRTQGGGVIHTAYIERLNATFRARLCGLVRRGRHLVQQTSTLHTGAYLVGTVYNFCTDHQSLRLPLLIGSRGRVHWVRRTPAMAAGMTDHRWTVQELLRYRVPPPRWSPPKRVGRPSKATQQLVAQWSG